jgi:hypothetical protein
MVRHSADDYSAGCLLERLVDDDGHGTADCPSPGRAGGKLPKGERMIIYHTAPVRSFPFLADLMAKTFRHSYHFRFPIQASNLADHRWGMLNHVLAYDYGLAEIPRRSVPSTGFPSDVLHNGINFVDPALLADIDFLYGVFDGALIKKREGDFVFTIISDPVRHIYDLFSYLEFVNSTSKGGERVIEGVALFDDIVSAGLNSFIDRFLAGDREIVVGGRTFYLIEDFFRFNLSVDYDYVGTEARIAESLAVLSNRLKIDLNPTERLVSTRSSIASESRYRYDGLRRCLQPEIVAYEAALAG